jgi:aspartate-semialdehyde dehydrogenase
LYSDKIIYYLTDVMKIALVGATGLVGTVMARILAERNFPVSDLIAIASEKSAGNVFDYNGFNSRILNLEDGVRANAHLALFSAGGSVSLEWAPRFADAGTVVIDNSSAWRMDPEKKLIVPEINGHLLTEKDRIIANPNCSTIQMVMALAPLHKKYRIKRLVISTYQSVTGTGAKAVTQFENERSGITGPMAYPHIIDRNCIPQCDVFTENGYTKEEMKLVHETRKILGDESIQITATCVRVPVMGGHSESVNVTFENDFDLNEVRTLLMATGGISLQDDTGSFSYPMPLYSAGKDDVFVGRLRRDESLPNSLNMWIVSDNLRKGAATNAVQIAELLVQKGLLQQSA